MSDKTASGRVIVMVFDGEYEGLANRLLAGERLVPLRVMATKRGTAVRVGRTNTKLAQAERYLLDALAEGGVPSVDLIDDAIDAGIGSYTLRVAKKRLGVISVKGAGYGAPWMWQLPVVAGGTGEPVL